MEGLALDHVARRKIVDFDTDAIDSLAEEILLLPVDRATKRRLFGYVEAYVALNRDERRNYAELHRELEGLNPVDGLPTIQSFSVRGVVNALKKPLGVLADFRAGKPIAQHELQQAREIVADAVRVTPREVLLAPSMPHQLRGARYAELVAAVETHAED